MAKQLVPLLSNMQRLDVEGWCRHGNSLQTIATMLGLSLTEFYEQMNADPALREAIARGRARGETDVTKALHQMASSGKDAGAARFFLERNVGHHWAPKASAPVITVVPLSDEREAEMMRSISERFRRQSLMLDGRIDENGDIIE